MNGQSRYEIMLEVRKQRLEERRRLEAQNELESNHSARGTPNNRQKHDWEDDPYTMENGTATFLYVITMIIGTLSPDRVLIYAVATFIWWKFISRHEK